MEKSPTPYPPSYEQSQGLAPHGHAGPYHNPPTNPDYKPQNMEQEHYAGQPAPAPVYPGYPPQNPGYPAHNAGYPPQNQGYPGYPPQNPGYPMQNPSYVTTVRPVETSVQYVVNTVPIAAGPLGPHRSAVMCPRCGTVVTTKTKQDPSILAWLSCGLLAIVGCFFGCCLIPFCIGGCQNVDHYCPQCNNYLGRYSRF